MGSDLRKQSLQSISDWIKRRKRRGKQHCSVNAVEMEVWRPKFRTMLSATKLTRCSHVPLPEPLITMPKDHSKPTAPEQQPSSKKRKLGAAEQVEFDDKTRRRESALEAMYIEMVARGMKERPRPSQCFLQPQRHGTFAECSFARARETTRRVLSSVAHTL